MKLFDNKIEFGGFIFAAALLVLILPGLNAFFPEGSALHFSGFQLSLWGKYIAYAVLAMSLNLLWGYTGLLCLCQSLFFALGGYAFGMYLMQNVGVDAAYGTALPDFMDFLGYKELPALWVPFGNPILAVFGVFLFPGLVAFVFGFLAFRSRIKGVYFSILTQALTYAVTLMFFQNEFNILGIKFAFGGNNGFTDFKEVFGADINAASTTRGIFIVSALLMLGSYLLISFLLKTKFGLVQQAIRDSENRVRFSGYSTTTYKLFIFVLSAMMAGAAGACFVPQAGIINPGEMTPAKSLDVVVWVALGGRGTKFGPILGAIVVSLLKSYATRAFPDSWLIILGLIFVLVVLFMPNGLVGLPAQFRSLKKRFSSSEAVTSNA